MDALTVIVIGIGVMLLLYTIQQTTTGAFDSAGDLMTLSHDESYPPGLLAFARAIATAEGFYTAGSVPNRFHNPGDLKIGNVGNGTGDTGITIFASDDEGFHYLYRQLEKIADGTTKAGYTLDMSFSQMANKWAEGDQNWASNVAASLGVAPSNQIGDFLG